MPRLPFIRWTKNQVDKLRYAVSQFNRTITNLANRYAGNINAPDLPDKITMAEARSQIKTRADLDRFYKDHTSILKKNDKRAQEVDDNGQLVWTNKEIKKQVRRERRRAERLLTEKFGDDWEDMSPAKKATALSDSDYRIPKETDYTTPQQLQDAWDSWGDLKHGKYIDNYIKGLKNADKTGDFGKDVADIVEKMAEQNPDYLDRIFDHIDGELSIDYVYKDSADKSPYSERENKIMMFWTSEARKAGVDLG